MDRTVNNGVDQGGDISEDVAVSVAMDVTEQGSTIAGEQDIIDEVAAVEAAFWADAEEEMLTNAAAIARTQDNPLIQHDGPSDASSLEMDYLDIDLEQGSGRSSRSSAYSQGGYLCEQEGGSASASNGIDGDNPAQIGVNYPLDINEDPQVVNAELPVARNAVQFLSLDSTGVEDQPVSASVSNSQFSSDFMNGHICVSDCACCVYRRECSAVFPIVSQERMLAPSPGHLTEGVAELHEDPNAPSCSSDSTGRHEAATGPITESYLGNALAAATSYASRNAGISWAYVEVTGPCRHVMHQRPAPFCPVCGSTSHTLPPTPRRDILCYRCLCIMNPENRLTRNCLLSSRFNGLHQFIRSAGGAGSRSQFPAVYVGGPMGTELSIAAVSRSENATQIECSCHTSVDYVRRQFDQIVAMTSSAQNEFHYNILRGMLSVHTFQIWSFSEAELFEQQTFGASSCGAVAVANVLRALHFKFSTADVQRVVPVKKRANSVPLAQYLMSRSCAGTTHVDLIESVQTLSANQISGRFFATYPSRKVALTHWLLHWLKQGAVPVLTMNLQRNTKPGGNIADAWHHQMVFGGGVSGMFLTNPVECASDVELQALLQSPSVLLVRQADILSRIGGELNEDIAPLVKLALSPCGKPWLDLNVAGQIIHGLRQTPSQNFLLRNLPFYPTTHVAIPAAYKAGITLFARTCSNTWTLLDSAPDLSLSE